MHRNLAQPVTENEKGQLVIENDWYPKPLPSNIFLDEMAYPDTAYSFASFYSVKPVGFSMGFASGNYGHGTFSTGKDGEIHIGKYVVLQCTRIIANKSVTIKDHCMFSWGVVITDSWVNPETYSPSARRRMLEKMNGSPNRHLEFIHPNPVVIEENVWVGFESMILPGVKIGRGAVIGCKTLITTDVPEYAVIVGNPSRIIRFLEPGDTKEIKEKALGLFMKS